MNVVMFAGFLGSGKTSMLLSTLPALKENNQSPLVIVNDIGDIGVDVKILKSTDDYQIVETKGGCICCTNSKDLIKIIQRIISDEQYNLIIIEPSGIANPGRIKSSIDSIENGAIKTKLFLIIDAERFDTLIRGLSDVLSRHVSDADVVLINKVDSTSPTTLSRIRGHIKSIGFQGKVIDTSTTNGIGIDSITRIIMEGSNNHIHFNQTHDLRK